MALASCVTRCRRSVEAARGARKRERDEQPHQPEDGALDGAEPRFRPAGGDAPAADAAPQLQEGQHAHEQPAGEDGAELDQAHGRRLDLTIRPHIHWT